MTRIIFNNNSNNTGKDNINNKNKINCNNNNDSTTRL